jgi:2-isopropylmalate synthase
VAHILRTGYGLDLPRALRVEVGRLVQRVTDETGAELEPSRLWEVFAGEYLDPPGQLAVKDRREDRDGDEVTAQVSLVLPGGGQVQTTGAGADGVTAVLAAVVAGLRHAGHATELRALSQHLVATGPAGVRTASYAELAVVGAVGHGVGLDASPSTSALGSVLSAANRLLAAEEGSRGWR